ILHYQLKSLPYTPPSTLFPYTTLFRSVLAPYVRNDASIDSLQQAAAALEKALRDRGFGLHRVSLPPQEVGASVRLTIVQFTIARDRKSTRLNSSHVAISYAVFCLKKKN